MRIAAAQTMIFIGSPQLCCLASLGHRKFLAQVLVMLQSVPFLVLLVCCWCSYAQGAGEPRIIAMASHDNGLLGHVLQGHVVLLCSSCVALDRYCCCVQFKYTVMLPSAGVTVMPGTRAACAITPAGPLSNNNVSQHAAPQIHMLGIWHQSHKLLRFVLLLSTTAQSVHMHTG